VTTAVQEAVDWLRKFSRMTHNTGFLWMSKEAGALADKLSADQSPIEVEIDVECGMVQQVKAPKGILVKVNDYDVLDVSPDSVELDINGHDYVEQRYEGTGSWVE